MQQYTVNVDTAGMRSALHQTRDVAKLRVLNLSQYMSGSAGFQGSRRTESWTFLFCIASPKQDRKTAAQQYTVRCYVLYIYFSGKCVTSSLIAVNIPMLPDTRKSSKLHDLASCRAKEDGCSGATKTGVPTMRIRSPTTGLWQWHPHTPRLCAEHCQYQVACAGQVKHQASTLRMVNDGWSTESKNVSSLYCVRQNVLQSCKGPQGSQ